MVLDPCRSGCRFVVSRRQAAPTPCGCRDWWCRDWHDDVTLTICRSSASNLSRSATGIWRNGLYTGSTSVSTSKRTSTSRCPRVPSNRSANLWSRHLPSIISLPATWSLVWACIWSLQWYDAYRDGGTRRCRGLDLLSLSRRSRCRWPVQFADVLASPSVLPGSAIRFDQTYVALSATELNQLGTYRSSSASWTEVDLLSFDNLVEI